MLSLLLITATAAWAADTQPVSRLVDQALLSNSTAENYSAWKESGNTPEDVFAAVKQIGTTSAWTQLCAKLGGLDDESLALFDEQIDDDGSPRAFGCRLALKRRLESHWQKARGEFPVVREAMTDEENGDATQAPRSPERGLISEERVIDTEHAPVLIDGGLKQREIALTFDDGPHPTHTRSVLATLKAAGVRATFFEVGEMARKHPELSKLIVSEGHTVGSHSWNHPQLSKLPLAAAEHNILLGHDTVMTATGVETPFFRFPYGAHNRALTRFIDGLKMATFYWNMDSLDWKLRDPSRLYQNVLRELDREKGGIILFHDIHEQTTIVLPLVLKELLRRHFKTVVFVPRLAAPKAY